MANSYGPKGIVTDGLVFSLDAGNAQCLFPSSSTSVNSIVNTCTGTLVTDGSYSTDNGGCFTFDGSDGRLDMTTNAPTVSGDATLCWWMRLAASQDEYVGLIGSYTYYTVGKNNLIQIQWYTSKLRLISISGTGDYDVDLYTPNAPAFSANTWFFVTIVFDDSANTFQPYWNGTTQGWGTTSADSRTIVGINEGITIGAYRQNGSAVASSTIDGEMGPVYIYNKALTQAEIQQNYNSQKARFGL